LVSMMWRRMSIIAASINVFGWPTPQPPLTSRVCAAFHSTRDWRPARHRGVPHCGRPLILHHGSRTTTDAPIFCAQ
jgi:hypothetical protein